MYKISCKKCVYFLLIVILVFLSSFATAFHIDRLTTRHHQNADKMSTLQDFSRSSRISYSSSSPAVLGDTYPGGSSDYQSQWYQYDNPQQQQTSLLVGNSGREHLEEKRHNQQQNHQRWNDDARSSLQWEDFDGTREDSNVNSSPEDVQTNLRISMDLNYENSQQFDEESSREDAANSSPNDADGDLTQEDTRSSRRSRNKWHFQLPPNMQHEELVETRRPDDHSYSNIRTEEANLRSSGGPVIPGTEIHLEDAQDLNNAQDKQENQRRHVRHSSSTFPHHRQRHLGKASPPQNLQNPPRIETTRSSSKNSGSQRSGRGAPHAVQTPGGRKATHNQRTPNTRFHHQAGQQQRPCQEQDVARKAYLANTVVEAKVQSMSLRRNVNYSVTFVVKKVHKQNGPPDNTLRLSFLNDTREENCEPGSGGGGRSRGGAGSGLVKAQLLQDKTYYLFLDNSGMHNYTVIGTPVQKKKRNIKDLEDIKKVCKNDFVPKPPRVFGLNNNTLELRENRNDSLRLICKTRGFPPPLISWRKNGKEVHSHGPLRITYKKKRSTLRLARPVQEIDSGLYECVARGVDGRTATAWVRVKMQQTPKNQRVSECEPKLSEEYCMNGGTCVYFPDIKEYACECPEGYKGLRCDSKEVSDRLSMYPPSNCKLGLVSKYYC